MTLGKYLNAIGGKAPSFIGGGVTTEFDTLRYLTSAKEKRRKLRKMIKRLRK